MVAVAERVPCPEDIEENLGESPSRLRAPYSGPYLIHWCVPGVSAAVSNNDVCRPIASKEPYVKEGKIAIDEALAADPYSVPKKLGELADKGRIRNIGLSKWPTVFLPWFGAVLRFSKAARGGTSIAISSYGYPGHSGTGRIKHYLLSPLVSFVLQCSLRSIVCMSNRDS